MTAKYYSEFKTIILESQEKGQKCEIIDTCFKINNFINNPELYKIIWEGQRLEIIKVIKYIGQILSLKNQTELEVNNRITQGWKQF